MLFRVMLVAVLEAVLEFLPSGWLSRELRLTFNYAESVEKVREWHSRELEKLDPMYRTQRAQLRLVAARERARERGVSVLDPDYPTLWDAEPLPDINRRFSEFGKLGERPTT